MMFNNLDVEAYDRQYRDADLLRRAAAYFRPHRRRLVLVVGGVAVVAALSASVPLVLTWAVNRFAAAGAAAVSPALVGGLTAFLLASWLLIWLGNYVRRLALARTIGDIVLTLRRDAFTAAASHDLSFYDRYASGRIVSRITSDTADIAQSVTLVGDLVSQIVEILIVASVATVYSWRLMLWTLLTVPVLVVFTLGFRAVARSVTRQGARAMAEVNAKTFETVAGIAVAKNFRREQTVYDEFAAVNRTSYRLNFTRGFTLALVFPVLNLLIGVGTALIVWRGALEVRDGILTLAAWFLFAQLIERIWFPIINISSFWSQVQVGFAAIERVFALIDAEPSVRQTANEPVPALGGDIVFRHVTFGYGDGAPVLPDFNLHIHAGESVALVGHTGAGKSSIARLVERFYEFQAGEILVDGRDVRTLDLTDYRRHLGIVPQAPFLFNGTVADNIRYARPSATDAEIQALARRIGDGEWLAALPDGLATDVGERGDRLSVGQRQLVALMRVIVQRPAIFVLDEATASIDPFTEAQIQEALGLILREATSIVIAHRLSTVQAADRILVLSGGQVIESGDHDALMRAGGHYAELYDTYFRHQSLDYVVPEDEPAGGLVELQT